MVYSKKKYKNIGLPPGTIETPSIEKKPAKMSSITYDTDKIDKVEIKSSIEFPELLDNKTIWLSIDSINDTDLISSIGKKYNIHSLTLEDIINVYHRPKYEDYENYIFMILKLISYDKLNKRLIIDNVCILLLKNLVITFTEKNGEKFKPIQNRLFNKKGRIRKQTADYLVYALTDLIVDNYYLVLEEIGLEIEDLEKELINNPKQATLEGIYNLKSQIILFRKMTWPIRELINSFRYSESDLLAESTQVYLRDLYDHVIQIIDHIETYRDVVSSMMDIYLTAVSNKMNEVMKVLTIIATIFIPITFIAGIYGMNFKYIPELSLKWGYFGVWGLIVCVITIMLIYFKKKGWL
ncbi:magnesium/cobalt transporter CorA [bacterium]